MKRYDSENSWSSGLVVRGTPTFDSTNGWNNAYQFLYTQNGYFSVWKSINGSYTALKSWTSTSTIKSNDWNTLKVTIDGTSMRFYINDTLVWSGKDSSLSSGQEGVMMYRPSSGTQILYVDWATLGMSDYFKAAVVEEGQREIPQNPSAPFVPEHSP